MSELKHLVESTNVRLKEQFRSEIQEEIAYFEDILENEEKLEGYVEGLKELIDEWRI